MGKRLIVAEKPSVARDIARVVGANVRGEGFPARRAQKDSMSTAWSSILRPFFRLRTACRSALPAEFRRKRAESAGISSFFSPEIRK